MSFDRKAAVKSFLRVVYYISDIEYQKRVWILGKGPECNDFTETVCLFFDAGEPIIEKYKEYGISDDQYQLLKKFRDDFEVFEENNFWAPEFIDTPEWIQITEKAKEILKAFNYIHIPYYSGHQKLDN